MCAASEVTRQALQTRKDTLEIRAIHAESDATHANAERAQAVDNNFCYEPVHKVLQDNLDGANCELAELRARETALEEHVNVQPTGEIDSAEDRRSTNLSLRPQNGRRAKKFFSTPYDG